MVDSLGVGIIGLSSEGSWAAATHGPAVLALPEFALRAVCTTRIDSARRAAERFGADHAFDDYRQLIASPDVDLVVVAVRVPYHHELVSAAIAAGKDVLCEWPLGNGLAEAEDLAAQARNAGIRAFIGLQNRSLPVVRRLQECIAGGEIGEILSTSLVAACPIWSNRIDDHHKFLADKRNGVTLLSIYGGHRLDTLCSCLGEFENVAATMANRWTEMLVVETGERVPKTSEDQVAVTGQLQGGAIASVHLRSDRPTSNVFDWEIHGTSGTIRVADPTGTFPPSTRLLLGRDEAAAPEPMAMPDDELAAETGLDGAALSVAHAYRQIARDMADGGSRVPTFEDAVVRHRLLQSIEEAALSGQRQICAA